MKVEWWALIICFIVGVPIVTFIVLYDKYLNDKWMDALDRMRHGE